MWKAFNLSWDLLVMSENTKQYNAHLKLMKRDFQTVPEAIEYVEQSWLGPYKEMFVAAWIDKVMHLGNYTSNRLQGTTEEQQRYMMKKFKEFVHPECISLVEPQHKSLGQGRPKKDQISNLTCRLPSEFEHVEASVSTPKPVKEKPRCKPKKSGVKSVQQPSLQSVNLVKEKPRAIPKVCVVESSKPKVTANLIRNMYLSEFPEAIRQYIHIIKDVKADGNCGYRAITTLMGGMEEEWMDVRNKLIRELSSNWAFYDRVFGENGRVKEVHFKLSYFDNEISAGRDRWMTMPNMGHLIASTYNVVLVHLSMRQCLTFLPLYSCSVVFTSRKVIAIGFVNEGHFVQAKANLCKMKEDDMLEERHFQHHSQDIDIHLLRLVGSRITSPLKPFYNHKQ
ncbi:hypothetical protein Vadar_022472 [Vaccinium darrowii]|uniref:Uncharacterized protein n=1 Tax=Vaccinium darrowii TaxID=229202 RepID=A0ACB7XBY8_9ERIC|nr:hypothetical protein Vadar_022472 [Vaccinium darrowii]